MTVYAQWRFVGRADESTIYINTEEYETEDDGSFALNLFGLIESYSAPTVTLKGLPSGLKYDAKTGLVAGKATKPGVYEVVVSVKNKTVKTPVTATFSLTVPRISPATRCRICGRIRMPFALRRAWSSRLMVLTAPPRTTIGRFRQRVFPPDSSTTRSQASSPECRRRPEHTR